MADAELTVSVRVKGRSVSRREIDDLLGVPGEFRATGDRVVPSMSGTSGDTILYSLHLPARQPLLRGLSSRPVRASSMRTKPFVPSGRPGGFGGGLRASGDVTLNLPLALAGGPSGRLDTLVQQTFSMRKARVEMRASPAIPPPRRGLYAGGIMYCVPRGMEPRV
jgi:hypothetical protein